jgi:hypothetical protein
MNTTLSTTPGRHDHPPHVVASQAREARRVGLLDQVALHVGIALIKWGRRPYSIESRERRANRVEQQLARLARERAADRSLRLSLPLR